MRTLLGLILFMGTYAGGSPVRLDHVPERHFGRWIRALNKNGLPDIAARLGAVDGDAGKLMLARVESSLGELRPGDLEELITLYQNFNSGRVARAATYDQIIRRTVQLMREMARPTQTKLLPVRRILFMYMQAALVLSRGPLPLRLASLPPDEKTSGRLNASLTNVVVVSTLVTGLAGLHSLDSPYDDEILAASLALTLAELKYFGKHDYGPRVVDYLAYWSWFNPRLKHIIREIAARVPGGPTDDVEQVRWFFDAYFNRVNSTHACASALNVL